MAARNGPRFDSEIGQSRESKASLKFRVGICEVIKVQLFIFRKCVGCRVTANRNVRILPLSAYTESWRAAATISVAMMSECRAKMQVC